MANNNIEFVELNSESIEVRYYDEGRKKSYLSWVIPANVICELANWWRKFNSKNVIVPFKIIAGKCEFNMMTKDGVYIREVDQFGRYKTTGWSLPSFVLDEILKKCNKRR